MSPVTGVLTTADAMSPDQLIEHVRRLERAGHQSVWIPDIYGREIYVTAGFILAHTDTIKVATGIAHVYGRDAVASVQAARTLSELSGGRFIQGLGVSHPVAAEMRGDTWQNPVTKSRSYLVAMRGEMPIHTPADSPPVPLYLAAHGPKMLAVAAELTDGANTYIQLPEHTREARVILGPDKTLNVVLPCCLSPDPTAARAAARRAINIYLPLPAYQRQWAKQGMGDTDWAGEGSDRLIDAYVAWGDADTIRARMAEHIDAGASAIVLRPVNPDPEGPEAPWDLIEAVAP